MKRVCGIGTTDIKVGRKSIDRGTTTPQNLNQNIPLIYFIAETQSVWILKTNYASNELKHRDYLK
jgi:hypothetical protein